MSGKIWKSCACSGGGVSPLRLLRATRSSSSQTPFSLCFWVPIFFKSLKIGVVCRALASAQKTSQNPAKTPIFKKSADRRHGVPQFLFWGSLLGKMMSEFVRSEFVRKGLPQ